MFCVLCCSSVTLGQMRPAQKVITDERFDPCTATPFGNIPIHRLETPKHAAWLEQEFDSGELPLTDNAVMAVYVLGLASFCGDPIPKDLHKTKKFWDAVMKLGSPMPFYSMAVASARQHDWRNAEKSAQSYICAQPHPSFQWKIMMGTNNQLRAVILNLPPALGKTLSDAAAHNCGHGFFGPS